MWNFRWIAISNYTIETYKQLFEGLDKISTPAKSLTSEKGRVIHLFTA